MQVFGSQADTVKLIENSFKGDECFWKFKACQTASSKKRPSKLMGNINIIMFNV